MVYAPIAVSTTEEGASDIVISSAKLSIASTAIASGISRSYLV